MAKAMQLLPALFPRRERQHSHYRCRCRCRCRCARAASSSRVGVSSFAAPAPATGARPSPSPILPCVVFVLALVAAAEDSGVGLQQPPSVEELLAGGWPLDERDRRHRDILRRAVLPPTATASAAAAVKEGRWAVLRREGAIKAGARASRSAVAVHAAGAAQGQGGQRLRCPAALRASSRSDSSDGSEQP